ncbi:unnamed protein product [Caenorhabditis angaria]|uniref:F-box domain-containing protein n=1 Tax=Caenorhabditis angaria TaxID=860376 RepID=A0A9P1J6M4_9PELO|nr:unnamed protein product [Caenorhabditis angaria]
MSGMDIDCENKTSTTITDIPIEIVEQIHTYLKSNDIVRLRGVSNSFQEFVDSLDRTESLNNSRVNQILHLTIRNNTIQVMNEDTPKYQNDPVKYPPEDFQFLPITGIRQLNWYRPIWLEYESSTILESSLDVTDFLEKTQDLLILNVLNTTDPISLKYNPTFGMRDSDSVYLTLNGNISFYKKSILSTILHKTQKFGYVYIDSDREIERDFDEDDYEGIEMFLKTKNSNPRKIMTLNFGTCPESVCDKLIELLHKWFGHGETEPGEIRNGQNILVFYDYDLDD